MRLLLCLAVVLTMGRGPRAAADDNVYEPGVTVQAYTLDQLTAQVPSLAPDQTPNLDEVIPRVAAGLDLGQVSAPRLVRYTGEISIPEKGHYTFRLIAPGGAARLTLYKWRSKGWIIADRVVGAPPEAVTDENRLLPGPLRFELDHLLPEPGDDPEVALEWLTPDAADFAPVPADALTTLSVPTRVTSPGAKRIETTRRPGDGKAVAGVHPGYDLSTLHPADVEIKVGALTVLADGRLIVGTFNPAQRKGASLPEIESKPPDELYEVRPLAGSDDPSATELVPVATGLFEPSGLLEVDGQLYVSHRRAVTALIDEDGDGYFETHRDVARGWRAWNYHQFTFGIVHRAGKLYVALSTAMGPHWEGMRANSAPNDPLRGCILEIDLNQADTPDRSFRVYAGGLRTPNTVGTGPDGDLFYADNQGTWMPTSHLAHVRPGRFYGHFNNTNVVPKMAQWLPDGGHASANAFEWRTPPTVYLPQNEFVNSPTKSALLETGPFAGQMLLGELTQGGIRRVFLEKVNGDWQGAAFRFSQGFEGGINRLVLGADGSITVGSIGAAGNWSWRGKTAGLQKITPNGKSAFEMHAVRATPDGFEITFTRPVDPAWLAQPLNYTVQQWHYQPTMKYGGPKQDLENLKVTSARPSADGTAVTLTIPGLKTGRCVYLRTDPTSTDGEAMWSTEAYYTLNQRPVAAPPAPATLAGQPVDVSGGLGLGVLTADDGVTLMGRTERGHFYRLTGDDPKMPRKGAITQDELLEIDPTLGIAVEPDSGSLITAGHFGDARVHVEWLAPGGGTGQRAGNSGVYLQDRYEIQVLGTAAGAEPAINEAGAIYNVKSADVGAGTGPDTWQAYDIWFRAPRFDAAGDKVEDARITVYWNGVLIHDDVALPEATGAAAEKPEVTAGPLVLQAHASNADGPVRYRNVWVAPLHTTTYTPGPWRDLFADGIETGWTPRGGTAPFTFEDGTVIGTAAATSDRNTFLVSDEAFTDFELSYEIWNDPGLNSGVQIRSRYDAEANRVRGPQIEADPTERRYSGGVYGEGTRFWLAPLVHNPAARSAWNLDAWNRVDVVARGPVVRTWVNGVPAASLFDAVEPSGRLGLQVHKVPEKQDGKQVRFRNFKIRELKQKSHP